jgi:hypothetical protein
MLQVRHACICDASDGIFLRCRQTLWLLTGQLLTHITGRDVFTPSNIQPEWPALCRPLPTLSTLLLLRQACQRML